jgi:hypothetical protein
MGSLPSAPSLIYWGTPEMIFDAIGDITLFTEEELRTREEPPKLIDEIPTSASTTSDEDSGDGLVTPPPSRPIDDEDSGDESERPKAKARVAPKSASKGL